MKKLSNIYFVLGTVILFILAGYSVYTNRQNNLPSYAESTYNDSKNIYNLNGVLIDTTNHLLIIEGTVLQHKNDVQFLFYAQGYNWLREDCAIELNTDLKSLQKGMAFFNWKLWDDLWQDKNEYQVGYPEIFIKHKSDTINPFDLIKATDSLSFRDLIFFGSPFFDDIAFKTPPEVDCTKCPMFETESSFLREKFKRESGESGYSIRVGLMPNVGEKIKVVIDFSKIQQREVK